MENMNDSVPEPGRDRGAANHGTIIILGGSANPDTTVTGDAGCKDMTINAMEVLEECLSKDNYVAKPAEGSETTHVQPSTAEECLSKGNYVAKPAEGSETSCVQPLTAEECLSKGNYVAKPAEGSETTHVQPSTAEECLSKGNYVAKPAEGSETRNVQPSTPEGSETTHVQTSTSSGYPNELSNSTDETAIEKEKSSTNNLNNPSEGLQLNNDQLSTSSDNVNQICNSPDQTPVVKNVPSTEQLNQHSKSFQLTNDQLSTSSDNVNQICNSPDQTSVVKNVQSTKQLNQHSKSFQLNNDQLSISSSNEISNSVDKAAIEKEISSTEQLNEPETLQLNNDQLSISSSKTNEICLPNSIKKSSSNHSKTNKDLLKKVLLKSTTAASRTTLPVPTQKKVEIFTSATQPQWYNVDNNLVTPRLISKNLPEAFNSLAIFGRPGSSETLEQFQDAKIREFIGCDLTDDEYRKLSSYCSPENAKTGKELSMSTRTPKLLPLPGDMHATKIYSINHKNSNLCIVKKQKIREEQERERDSKTFIKGLKYRGIRFIPLNRQEMEADEPIPAEDQLEPGRDLLFHIRIYRPFNYNLNYKNSMAPCRHSIFCRDAVISGQSPLHALRESLICPNDVDTRHDLSNAVNTDMVPGTTPKEMFPSGFMFINNVFYVDDRPGCTDMSAVIREWAVKRGIGAFDKRPMSVKMQDVSVRLCHPEVYVHQGKCEHIFTISEVRLVNASDPLNASHYPCHTSLSQHQSAYCTTCAEYCSKWIVDGSNRVPFDPAFYCDQCLKSYLYKDGVPLEDFKVYGYNSNETNILKIRSEDQEI